MGHMQKVTEMNGMKFIHRMYDDDGCITREIQRSDDGTLIVAEHPVVMDIDAVRRRFPRKVQLPV